MGITVLKKTAGASITPRIGSPHRRSPTLARHHPVNLDTSGRALLPRLAHVITTEDGEKNLQAEGLTNVIGLAPWDTFIAARDPLKLPSPRCLNFTARTSLKFREGRSRYWFLPCRLQENRLFTFLATTRTSRCRGNCSAHCSR